MSDLDKDIEKTIERLKEDIDFNKNRTTIVCFREDVENVLSNRENWKNIAEKLAKYFIDYVKSNVSIENYIPPTTEELLDWARKEVLKNE